MSSDTSTSHQIILLFTRHRRIILTFLYVYGVVRAPLLLFSFRGLLVSLFSFIFSIYSGPPDPFQRRGMFWRRDAQLSLPPKRHAQLRPKWPRDFDKLGLVGCMHSSHTVYSVPWFMPLIDLLWSQDGKVYAMRMPWRMPWHIP